MLNREENNEVYFHYCCCCCTLISSQELCAASFEVQTLNGPQLDLASSAKMNSD